MIGAYFGTITSIALAYSITSGIIFLIPELIIPGKLINLKIYEVFKSIYSSILGTIFMALVVLLVSNLIPSDLSSLLQLIIKIFSCILSYLIYFLIFKPKIFLEIKEYILK